MQEDVFVMAVVSQLGAEEYLPLSSQEVQEVTEAAVLCDDQCRTCGKSGQINTLVETSQVQEMRYRLKSTVTQRVNF